MRYLRVRWHHNHADEPVEFYSELDDAGWERRKVEIFRDGTMGFASRDEAMGSTVLGELPVPSVEQIATDAQFDPTEISKDDFERVWAKRLSLVRSA